MFIFLRFFTRSQFPVQVDSQNVHLPLEKVRLAELCTNQKITAEWQNSRMLQENKMKRTLRTNCSGLEVVDQVKERTKHTTLSEVTLNRTV